MSRKSILPPETLELYDRVFETYKQEVKLNPDYSFSSHCKQWNVNASKLNERLCREGIFINKLKQESTKVQSANCSYSVQRFTKRRIYYSKQSNYLIISLCVFLLYLLFSSAECLTHSFF